MATTGRHTLSEKDVVTLMGICAVCGPVDLIRTKDRRGCVYLACAAARRAARSRHSSAHKRTRSGVLRIVATEMRATGSCSMCGATTDLHLDHDHETGLYRDILCRRHNVGLGCFDDSIEQLLLAVQYLRKHA